MEKHNPEPATLVGYGAIIGCLQLQIPMPHKLQSLVKKHKQYSTKKLVIYTPRHQPMKSNERTKTLTTLFVTCMHELVKQSLN
jgi:hypothetical protein